MRARLGLTPAYSARARLSRLLGDGNTVAAYRAGFQLTGSSSASAWASYVGDTKYLVIPDAINSTASTPASAATRQTGDLAMVFRCALDDWTPGALGLLGGTWNGSTGYCAYIGTDGVPHFVWKPAAAGSVDKAATAAPVIANGATLYVAVTFDVDDGAGNNVLKFFTSSDGSTWTQLGSTVTTAGATDIGSTNNAFVIGNNTVYSQQLAGKYYSARLYGGIPAFLGGGASNTPVLQFNASDFSITSTNGETAVSSTTGETWTLVNTSSSIARIETSPTLLQATGANQPAINADGSLTTVSTASTTGQFMQTAAFTLNQPVTAYLVMTPTYNKAWYQVYFGGIAADSSLLYNPNGGTNLEMFAGGAAISAAGPSSAKHVFTAVLNGASSGWGVDGGALNTGNAGANNMGGITMAAWIDGSLRANATYWEVIVRNVADSAATQARIQTYLKQIYGT